MRRLVGSLALGVALIATSAAAAAFQPIERRGGEIDIPRVRAGKITIPAAHRKGRITVILTLADPPLAAYSRTLAGTSATRTGARLQRYYRDMAMVRTHRAAQFEQGAQEFGRGYFAP